MGSSSITELQACKRSPASGPVSPQVTSGKGPSQPVVLELLAFVVPVVLIVQMLALLLLELRATSISNALALERVQRMAQLRTGALAEPVWRLEYDKVRASLDEVTLEMRVVEAVVYDDTGAPVARVAGQSFGKPVTDTVVRELEYHDGNVRSPTGRLVIAFAARPLHEQLIKLYGSGVFVSALAGLVLCIALRLAAQSLIGRPLAIIMSAIHRARVEGTPQPLQLDSNNEFSALASAFNENVAALPRLTALLEQGIDANGLIDRLLLGLGSRERHCMAPRFHCPCTRERALRTLSLLEPEELDEMIRRRASQEIVCEFCGRAYQIEGDEMRPLLAAMERGELA